MLVKTLTCIDRMSLAGFTGPSLWAHTVRRKPIKYPPAGIHAFRRLRRANNFPGLSTRIPQSDLIISPK